MNLKDDKHRSAEDIRFNRYPNTKVRGLISGFAVDSSTMGFHAFQYAEHLRRNLT
jgi:hypothetical protein